MLTWRGGRQGLAASAVPRSDADNSRLKESGSWFMEVRRMNWCQTYFGWVFIVSVAVWGFGLEFFDFFSGDAPRTPRVNICALGEPWGLDSHSPFHFPFFLIPHACKTAASTPLWAAV
ncbi:hypothetical protein ACP275_09G030800 [Erythranthe tilingii]